MRAAAKCSDWLFVRPASLEFEFVLVVPVGHLWAVGRQLGEGNGFQSLRNHLWKTRSTIKFKLLYNPLEMGMSNG